ncbi:hypothetical protein BGY98DRAFT_948675 [Russula aff. rugulosa BPL654]|nr:hypothetical protein BGY98DRAFT_948675 [Russula aff. rugulosa BPL654]
MPESLSSELTYEGSLDDPSDRDTPNIIPDERIPTSPAQAAEQSPDSFDPHAPDTTHGPQPDNRLSIVSAGAVSLEPRRRSRHHHGHHHHSRSSHLHRELSHMLSVSSRDSKELRRGLSAAFDRLDQSRVRATHAEKLALDTLLRVREAETERADAMRQASTAREELGKYKALLDNAHGEIRRAQQMVRDQEQLRYEAEASAARDRDTARLMKQRRLIDLAREQGRKLGFNEGIQAGQRIGYHEGRSPTEDEGLYPDEGPRFREMFDESRYRLDEFDQPQPFRDTYLNPLSPHDAEIPTPLPRRQVYPRLQGQRDVSGSTIDATNPVSEPTYSRMPPTGVPRTTSTDSSSTTTLPAAPATLHVSSRAPPPMPTIPEVPSVGSGSWTMSPRDSQRTQSHIQPASAPQVSTSADILPPVGRYSQGDAAFVPPPGIVDDTHTGPFNGNRSESGSHIYESPSPRRAFDNPSVLDNGIIPDVSRSSVHENFPTATGVIQSPTREYHETFPEHIPSPGREHFEPYPQPLQSPAREHFETFPQPLQSPAREHFETFPQHIRKRFETFPQPFQSPAREHFETFPQPIRSPAREHLEASPRAMQSPARERFQSSPEATRGPSREYPESSSRTMQNPTRERSETPSRAVPGPSQERFSTHRDSPKVNRAHSEGVRFAGEFRSPESSSRPSSRPGGTPPQRDGPPRRRPNPQMPTPLAPQYGANPSYAYGPYSTAQRGRQPQSDYRMPRDAGLNAAPNPASNWYPRSSHLIPNPAERPTDRAPEQRTHAQSPRIPSEQLHNPGSTHGPPLTTTPPTFAEDYPAGRSRSPQNPPPRPHVQIPPTRYSAPDSASPRLATSPATGSRRDIPPAETYSPRSTSPNPNIRPSSSANQSPPRRYPPTLYNEPHLQSTTGDYERELIPPADHSNGSSRQRTGITSSRTGTPTDTLPIRPPSVSPRPGSAAFAQPVPPPQGATPRRPVSPNPLPRGVSPAPLPRASSPAPLPIRSPSVRSNHIHRSPSDVSLPGAPGSPYKPYNPSLEADIAVLASSSVDKFAGPSR